MSGLNAIVARFEGLRSAFQNQMEIASSACATTVRLTRTFLDAKEVLDDNGGTDVFPVTPSNLKITQGIENLKCLRLTDKGMIRWYAGCCKTPIANSMPSHRAPFAGVIHTIINLAGDAKTRDDALGPVRARVQGKYGVGKLPKDAYQTAPLGVIFSTIRFLLIGWIKGQHTPSPFFDSNTGEPKVKPYVLTSTERENLRKFCGPKPRYATVR